MIPSNPTCARRGVAQEIAKLPSEQIPFPQIIEHGGFERQMLDSVSGDALLDLIAHERHQVRLEVADAAQNIRMRETEIVVAGETGYDDSWLVDRIFSYCAFEDVLAPYLVGDAIGHIGA